MKLAQFFNNPLISIEFRLRMRSRRTPWVIIFYLITMAVISLGIILIQTYDRGYINPNNSKELFMIISIIQYALVCLLVPALTSGTISGEREKQTLNILLTTKLSSTKTIIGKWFSSLSFMLLLIISAIPIFGVVFLYGGIAPIQLLQMLGLYLITMFAIGSLGVLFSTLFKKTLVAIILTYITIIAYTILTALIPEIIRQYTRYANPGGPYQQSVLTDWFYSINPYFEILHVFNLENATNPLPLDPLWIFMIFFALVTIISLLLAIHFIKPVRKKLKLKK